ncbi:unnamed protein product [Closterium sp. Naga37s-1]|nr:unnamed protein product [Closterium sp. Naga37s-1]
MPGAREFRAEQERREEERRAEELREQERGEAEERRLREEEERRLQLKTRAATIVANAPSWENPEKPGVIARESSPLQLPRRRPLTLQIDDAVGDCNVVTVASPAIGSARPPRQGAWGSERSPRSAPLATAAFASAQSAMAGAKSPGSISRGAARSFGSPSPMSLLPPKSPAAQTWGAAERSNTTVSSSAIHGKNTTTTSSSSSHAAKFYGASPLPPAFQSASRKKDALPPLSPTRIPPHALAASPATKARFAYPRSKSSAEAEGLAREGKSAEPEHSPGWDDVGEVNRVQSLGERVRGSGRACAADAEDVPSGVTRAKTVEGRIEGSGGGRGRGGAAGGAIEVRGVGEGVRRGEVPQRRPENRFHSKSMDLGSGGMGCNKQQAEGALNSPSNHSSPRNQGNRGNQSNWDNQESPGGTAGVGDGKARVGSERIARRGLVKHASVAEKGRRVGRGGHRRAVSWAVLGELRLEGREDGVGSELFSRRPPAATTAGGRGEAEAKANGSGPSEPIQIPSAVGAAGGADSAAATREESAEADERGQWEEAELQIRTRFFKASRNRLFSLAAKGLSSFSKLLAAASAAAAGAAAGMGVGGVGVNVLGGAFGEVEERYEVEGGKELGAGQFGVTRVVVCRSTGRRLACKTIHKAAFKSKFDIENVRREVAILNLLKSHPNVIHLEEPIETPHAIHLIMELCSGGELFERIKERRRYSEREAAVVMRAVLGVLQSCHQRHHVVHRDIKPENILLAHPSSPIDVRVIDFGVAAFLKPGGKMLTDAVGSLFYIAPEVLSGSYGTPADVWSAGVVLYVLLAGVPPFWAETEAGVTRAIKEAEVGFKGSAWRGVTEEGKDLILRMLDRDQKRRVSAQEALGPSTCSPAMPPAPCVPPNPPAPLAPAAAPVSPTPPPTPPTPCTLLPSPAVSAATVPATAVPTPTPPPPATPPPSATPPPPATSPTAPVCPIVPNPLEPIPVSPIRVPPIIVPTMLVPPLPLAPIPILPMPTPLFPTPPFPPPPSSPPPFPPPPFPPPPFPPPPFPPLPFPPSPFPPPPFPTPPFPTPPFPPPPFPHPCSPPHHTSTPSHTWQPPKLLVCEGRIPPSSSGSLNPGQLPVDSLGMGAAGKEGLQGGAHGLEGVGVEGALQEGVDGRHALRVCQRGEGS